MANKQDFENCKILKTELEVSVGYKIAKETAKTNDSICAILEHNKNNIIQSLRNEISALKNRVS